MCLKDPGGGRGSRDYYLHNAQRIVEIIVFSNSQKSKISVYYLQYAHEKNKMVQILHNAQIFKSRKQTNAVSDLFKCFTRSNNLNRKHNPSTPYPLVVCCIFHNHYMWVKEVFFGVSQTALNILVLCIKGQVEVVFSVK